MKAKILGLLAVGLLVGPMTADAVVIYESATLGPTGQIGGISVDGGQFLGSRFSLSSSTNITAIGGHLSGFSGGFFGAIVSLAGPGALPTGSPFASGEVLASTTFALSSPSDDQSFALPVTLGPGDYAVIFGGTCAGCSGAMPNNNADIGAPGYFFWRGRDSTWLNAGFRNARFVVYGDSASVPEPGTLALLGLGLAGVGLSRRRLAA